MYQPTKKSLFTIFVRNLKATQTPLNQSQHTLTKHAPIATYVYG